MNGEFIKNGPGGGPRKFRKGVYILLRADPERREGKKTPNGGRKRKRKNSQKVKTINERGINYRSRTRGSKDSSLKTQEGKEERLWEKNKGCGANRAAEWPAPVGKGEGENVKVSREDRQLRGSEPFFAPRKESGKRKQQRERKGENHSGDRQPQPGIDKKEKSKP